MFMRVPLILCLLALAACASPKERCILDATKDLRTVNALIAESEANLARGYAIDRELERRPRLTFCAGGIRSNVGLSFCRGSDIYVRDRPVALDPEAEQRKLALLRERKARLEIATQPAVAACGA